MKLNEIKLLQESEDQFLDNIDDIIDWLEHRNKRTDFTFDKDTVKEVHKTGLGDAVSIDDDVDLSAGSFTKFLVKFYQTGNFLCMNGQLESLEGSPREVYGEFNCAGNNLKSLKGAPPYCSHSMWFYNNPIESLEDVHEIIKQVNGKIWLPETIKRGGIGLIFVEQLKSVSAIGSAKAPFDIIKKYLRQPNRLYECQAELIDNGFEEYAIL